LNYNIIISSDVLAVAVAAEVVGVGREVLEKEL
jgi:hypothetical protein